MTGNLARIGRIGWVIGLSTLLTGCIVVPLPMATPAPDIVPKLPEDLRNSDLDVLVLTTHTKGEGGTRSRNEYLKPPIFMKAKNLASLTQKVNLESGTTVAGVMLNPSFIPIAPVASTTIDESLGTLCLIVSDGRTFTFSGGHAERGFAVYQQETLGPARHDAIVSALRARGANAFDEVDGPCDIGATGVWPPETSSKVTEFLARMPSREKKPSMMPIARLFESEDASASETRAEMQQVMVLASAKWRNRTIVEAPVFLSTTNVSAIIDTFAASKGEDILPVFRSIKSGSYSASKIELERVCAISSEGHVAWWSREDKAWKRLSANPPFREWREDVLAVLAGTRQSGWDEGCAPSEIGWSAEEKRQTVVFLEKLPSQERPSILSDSLLARSTVLFETADARATDVMLLCYPWCIGQNGYYLTPVFLRVDDLSMLIGRLKSSTMREFMTFLTRLVQVDRPALEISGVLHIYVMGSDGVVIELGNEKTMVWKERKRFQVSSAWRSDAMDVVRQDFKNLRGSDVLFLASTTGWPDDTRMKVVTFLERMPVRNVQPAKP